VVVADGWFSDSKWMQQVTAQYQGTLLVKGKNALVCCLTCRLLGAIVSSFAPAGVLRVR
jgi:hypothetical protein